MPLQKQYLDLPWGLGPREDEDDLLTGGYTVTNGRYDKKGRISTRPKFTGVAVSGGGADSASTRMFSFEDQSCRFLKEGVRTLLKIDGLEWTQDETAACVGRPMDVRRTETVSSLDGVFNVESAVSANGYIAYKYETGQGTSNLGSAFVWLEVREYDTGALVWGPTSIAHSGTENIVNSWLGVINNNTFVVFLIGNNSDATGAGDYQCYMVNTENTPFTTGSTRGQDAINPPPATANGILSHGSAHSQGADFYVYFQSSWEDQETYVQRWVDANAGVGTPSPTLDSSIDMTVTGGGNYYFPLDCHVTPNGVFITSTAVNGLSMLDGFVVTGRSPETSVALLPRDLSGVTSITWNVIAGHTSQRASLVRYAVSTTNDYSVLFMEASPQDRSGFAYDEIHAGRSISYCLIDETGDAVGVETRQWHNLTMAGKAYCIEEGTSALVGYNECMLPVVYDAAKVVPNSNTSGSGDDATTTHHIGYPRVAARFFSPFSSANPDPVERLPTLIHFQGALFSPCIQSDTEAKITCLWGRDNAAPHTFLGVEDIGKTTGVTSEAWPMPTRDCNCRSYEVETGKWAMTVPSIRQIRTLNLLTTPASDKPPCQLAGDTYEFDFAPVPPAVISANRQAFIGSGQLLSYDGVSCSESTFMAAPNVIVYSESDADETTLMNMNSPAGDQTTSFFRATWRWVDDRGNTHRSPPTPPISISHNEEDVGGGDLAPRPIDEIWVTPPPLGGAWYEQANNSIYLELWRDPYVLQSDTSAPGIAPPFTPEGLFALIAEAKIDPTGSDLIIFTGTDLQTTVQDNELDPAPWGGYYPYNGGVVEPDVPPVPWDLAADKRRVWLVDAENRDRAYFSKIVRERVSPEFPGAFYVQVPQDAGDIEAVEILDDKIILLTRTGLYYVAGEGPNDSGQGSYTQPRSILSPVGCTNRNSVVTTQEGIFFEFEGHIYLLDRSLSLIPIGDPVEDTTQEYTLLDTAVLPASEEVLWLATDGTDTYLLVFNYGVGQWALWPSVIVNDTPNTMALVSSNSTNRLHILTQSQDLYYIDPDARPDVSMVITTPWFKLTGIQNFQRIYKFLLLGRIAGSTDLGTMSCGVFYDYVDTLADTIQLTISTASATDPLELELRPDRQRVQSVKLRLTHSGSKLQKLTLTGLATVFGAYPTGGDLRPTTNRLTGG